MRPNQTSGNQRLKSRMKAVLPVRVKGKDVSGENFEELVHTLDMTPDGVRIGSLRRELHVTDEVTVFFRQRKIQFRVMWIKKLQGTNEFQIGLKALTQDRDAWGLHLPDCKSEPVAEPVAAGAV